MWDFYFKHYNWRCPCLQARRQYLHDQLHSRVCQFWSIWCSPCWIQECRWAKSYNSLCQSHLKVQGWKYFKISTLNIMIPKMKILSFSFANPNLDINVGRLLGTSCHPSNSLYISVESNLSNRVDPDSPPVTIKTLKYKLSIHLIISIDL